MIMGVIIDRLTSGIMDRITGGLIERLTRKIIKGLIRGGIGERIRIREWGRDFGGEALVMFAVILDKEKNRYKIEGYALY